MIRFILKHEYFLCTKLLFLFQILTNALLKTNATRMLYVATPKDPITALVREDLRATEELTARVRFC